MGIRTRVFVAATGVAFLAGFAVAQDDAATGEDVGVEVYTADEYESGLEVNWSDSDFERIASMLRGSWRTTEAVAETGGDGEGLVNVVMHVEPVIIDDVPDAMYVELAREDAQDRPYRQAVFQLYRHRDGIRLRTYEFHQSFSDGLQPLAGMWMAPDLFPPVSREDLIATLDVALAEEEEGVFEGETPYPYPTGIGGAVEMTSRMRIEADRIVSIDRGYNADGEIVWGSGEDGRYEFARFEPDVRIERHEDGLVVFEYARPEGDALQDGDRVQFHYSGWVAENGHLFDSSDRSGRPFAYEVREGAAIPGWGRGVRGSTVGTIRRIYVPAALGYGERGAPQAGIPANADLIFEARLMELERPDREPAEEPGDAPEMPDTPDTPDTTEGGEG